MRVLITTGIFPPDIGGPATYVPKIAGALQQAGHHVAVVTLGDAPGSDGATYAFEVHRVPRGLPQPLRVARTVATIRRTGRATDVIFGNGLYLETALANTTLQRPLVWKVVADPAWEMASNRGWTSDGVVDFQRRRQGWRAELLRGIRNFAISRADRIIVPSRYVAGMVRGWGIQQDRLSLIYNAVEPPDDVRAAAIPLDGRIKVVTVSRLIACKQLDVLIEAVSRLDGVGLLIVGDGPERSHLEELSGRLGLGDRVRFVGAKSKSETLQLIAGCDIFALNSTHEGFPHVVLEAMSLGVPVVATAVGGTVEIVRDGENGRLIEPRDHGGLLRVLSVLASSPAERRRLALAAKASLAAFSYRGMLEATEAVLSEGAESMEARPQNLRFT